MSYVLRKYVSTNRIVLAYPIDSQNERKISIIFHFKNIDDTKSFFAYIFGPYVNKELSGGSWKVGENRLKPPGGVAQHSLW